MAATGRTLKDRHFSCHLSIRKTQTRLQQWWERCVINY